MRLVTYEHQGRTGVGIAGDGGVAPTAYDDMAALIRDGATPEPTGDPFDPDRLLVPVRPSKVLCCGINYRAHGEEAAGPAKSPPGSVLLRQAADRGGGPR